ncbi:MAG TPA: hypothetical protein VM940_01025 [Chthoniobacterales bacterium]|jgi:hypothetical protein|nr:hypothetical protein [Chthoniobacterales bacterium]
MRTLSSILLLLALTVTPVLSKEGNDKPAIIAAAQKFATENATITVKIALTVEAVDGDFARVRMAPEESGKGDPAWIFLKKNDGKWTGLTLGSSFTTEDYQQLGIPNALRVP